MTDITLDYKEDIQHPSVYKDEDVEVFIEDSTIGWMLHCHVFNWSKGVYSKLLDLLVDIIKHAPRNEVYALSFDDKLTKFAAMFGLESIDTFTEKATGRQGELLGLCAIL